jgi:hypothetical protein
MKALFVLLMALATGAQAQQPTPCLKLKKIEKHVLHQNGATLATLTFEEKHCYVLNESKNIGRQGPVLEITTPPGISATVEGVGVVLFDPATADLKPRQIAAKLNLTATPEAALGRRSLQVLVHYQVMDSLGNIHDETLPFNMSIKVAQVEHVRPPFEERHPAWAKILLPLEFIAVMPLCFLKWLVGAGGCL